jgi:competence protein ComEC
MQKMPVARSFFQKIPFIRITSLFMIGILINHYFSLNMRMVATVLAILISTLILFWHNSNFASIQIQNIILSVSILLLGVFYPDQQIENNDRDFNRKDYFLAEVCQKPGEKAKTFQTIILIQNDKLTVPEKIVAYFSKVGFDSTITTGDQLIILTKPQKIKNAGNPFEFDYQTLLHQRNIWFSVYLANGTYLKTHRQTVNISNWAEKVRDRLVAMLAEALPDKEERSVVSALTLGYRTEIDQNTLDYFASTGAMHVLSVSGLHVALIFMILGFLLSFLKRGKIGPVVFSIVMISFLWIYAFISGFSPPVQRSTVMFTFVIIGNGIRRPVNIYNSLTTSALFLILLSPNVLFDVGFQLSYLAIFGIVLIQPALNNIFELTNPILNWTWSLFTVSVAAQLMTFPLGFFYFNQFPNLFWLSNFVVVPITTFIMWFGIAFFIFSPFHRLAMFVGWIIQKLTYVMLAALKAMDAQPLALTRGIVLTTAQLWILYGIIVVLLVYGFSKRKPWLFYGLFLIIALQCSVLETSFKLLDQKQIFVYNTRNTMIHLINGRNDYLITNGSEISENDLKMTRKVMDHLKLHDPIILDKNKIQNFQSADLILKNNALQFLNSIIKFNEKSKFQNADILSLQAQSKNINISTGNPNFKGNEAYPINFRTKTEGAFLLKLK